MSPAPPSLRTAELQAPTPFVAPSVGTPAHGRAGEVVAGGSGKKKTIKLNDRELRILVAVAELHEAVPGIAQ